MTHPYHSYIFFDVEASIHDVPRAKLMKDKQAFVKLIENGNAGKKNIRIHAYSTLAFKADTRFMLHANASTPESIQLFIRDLLHTDLGRHIRVRYTLFGMTRPSPYKPKGAPVEKEGAEIKEPDVFDTPHRYLVVYPFTKTIEWHLLPMETRGAVMKAHVAVGRKWNAAISQLLLYAYGVDDHEFIVSYYTDSLQDFQSLVMDMRGTESRRHTKSDTPIFTCVHMPIREALEML